MAINNPDEIPPGIQEEQAIAAEHKRHRNYRFTANRKTRFEEWVNALLLVVGIVTAAAMIEQALIMSDTLIEIRDGGQQTERLAITGLGQLITARKNVDTIAAQTRVIERGRLAVLVGWHEPPVSRRQPVTAWFKLQNYGTTELRNIRVTAMLTIVSTAEHIDFSYPGNRYFFSRANLIYPMGIDPAKSQVPIPMFEIGSNHKQHVLEDEEASQITNHSKMLVEYGIVRYSDAFGIEHWTQFCGYSDDTAQSSEAARDCTLYSNADTNQ